MRKSFVVSVIAAGLSIAGVSHADESENGKAKGKGKASAPQSPRPSGAATTSAKGKGDSGDFMKRHDKDKDGNISKQEVPEQTWVYLSKLDKNGDLTVSKAEFAANRAATYFARTDKNKDGKITRGEAPSYWGTLAKSDLNKDGGVTRDELTRARNLAARTKTAAKGKGRMAGTAQPSGPNAIFGKYDENKDGRLNREEVPEALWARLSKADDNADGRVTREELVGVYIPAPAAKGGKPKRPALEKSAP